MGRKWWSKFILLLFFIGLSAVYVYPTLVKLDLEKTNFPFKKKINLGLDLQGGLYLVMGVDFNKVYKDVIERQASSLKKRFEEKKILFKTVKAFFEGDIEDPRVRLDFEVSNREEIHTLIKKEYWNLRLTDERSGFMELGLAHAYRRQVREQTISQSIEVIRNRIDEFGVAEPSITSQGNDRVVVELPGVREIDRAKALIGRTAKLEFKMVDESVGEMQLATIISQIEKDNSDVKFKEGKDKFSDYVDKINKLAKGKIPEESEIAFRNMEGKLAEGGTQYRRPVLLKRKVELTGDLLDDAQVSFDQQDNRPIVNFSLNPRGATIFDKVTAENIKKRLAIVLDNIIHSDPVIQSRISAGRGQITLGSGSGEDLMREAKDLAIVLRAGALPAQLELLEQRVVGPSLGQDSIRKSALASLIGAAFVFFFIMIYYRGSGVIAAISLVFNVLFVLAILVGLEATLTLPGIAGIALTVGIAVDSNVVIYERIREEFRLGKSIRGSVEAGFQKAIRTILDANITNAAAAIVLLAYGTGPIKGFAVTLLVGIVTTLFSAVFVCRLFFDFYVSQLENRRATKISI